jgi:hypothetical protein
VVDTQQPSTSSSPVV